MRLEAQSGSLCPVHPGVGHYVPLGGYLSRGLGCRSLSLKAEGKRSKEWEAQGLVPAGEDAIGRQVGSAGGVNQRYRLVSSTGNASVGGLDCCL